MLLLWKGMGVNPDRRQEARKRILRRETEENPVIAALIKRVETLEEKVRSLEFNSDSIIG